MDGVVLVEEAPATLDPEGLLQRLDTKGCGAIVSFVGLTRETEGDAQVLRLEFDAWQDKLQPVLQRLAQQAIREHGVWAVAMAHRTGSVGPQEPIVAIHVASPHRKEASVWIRQSAQACPDEGERRTHGKAGRAMVETRSKDHE